MIPLFSINEVCPIRELDIHCKELTSFKYIHDFVRDILFDIFRQMGVSMKNEAPVNFLIDPLNRRSTFRHVDVMVCGWVGRKHVCVDLIGVSPLLGLGVGDFTVWQATLKVASSKVAKHENACSDNQHGFIPFAFDTFDFLGLEVVDLLHRVQRVMHNNAMSPMPMNVVFTMIDFVIQKGLITQPCLLFIRK